MSSLRKGKSQPIDSISGSLIKKEGIRDAISAGKNFKNWREYAFCGYKYAQVEADREKRVNRMILVGNAIDAFEDVP